MPPLTGMQAIKALMQEFDSIDAYLQAVDEIMQEGHMPDIAGLDNRIARLCDTVQNVETDIQARCIAKLDDLLKKLDTCEEKMSEFHNAQKQSAAQ